MCGRGALIVIGVSGSGKSSLAQALASHFSLPVVEGDDLHPPQNVQKMSGGTPLDDDDRWPWLDSIAGHLNVSCSPDGAIGVCSALRRRYRNRLRQRLDRPPTFLLLDTCRDLLYNRMASRVGHFMPISLLDSQLTALERPTDEPDVILMDASCSIAQLVAQALIVLGPPRIVEGLD